MSKKVLYQCDICNKPFETKATAEYFLSEKFIITIGDSTYSDICYKCRYEIKQTFRRISFKRNKSTILTILKGITK